jgi:AAA+ superfamily predicted ATPase
MRTTVPPWRSFATELIERQAAARADQHGWRGWLRRDPDADVARLTADDDPFALVVAFCELDAQETRILAVCAAVETDRRLQRLVAGLTADPLNFRCDVDLLTTLLGSGVLAALTPESRLLRSGLVEVDDDRPLAAARVVVPHTVAWALQDEAARDPDLPLDAEIVTSDVHAETSPVHLLVHGTDRERCVRAARDLLWGSVFVVTPVPADDDGWRGVVRQASAYAMGVVLLCDEQPDARLRWWVERADHVPWALVSRNPLPLEWLPDLRFEELGVLADRVGEEEWKELFVDVPMPSRQPTAEQLRALARVVTPGERAIARLASGTLVKHARRIVPTATWDDLILPASQEQRLRDLVARYRNAAVVHHEWGMKAFPSPGVVALFSGISGTGKTTAAEVVAHELGIDMFKVDLSAVVSKYIGETEKNLEEIFSAANAGGYLLLFDEADSLFGSRAAVSDARDRYANIEVSYLLQRLETYDGFVVLTSNFQGNIDDAFLRRIHASVHFPMPNADDRRRIWDHSLADAPRGDDLDLDYLARGFEIAGGSIRNASLSAAHLAAARGGPIGMTEALQGLVNEFMKLRRRVNRTQLGRWADLVDGLDELPRVR